MSLPEEPQATISSVTKPAASPEATAPTPQDTTSQVEATQDPPRSPKRKAAGNDESPETIQAPPKKRKVTFAQVIYVRSEANIDTLRHHHTSPPTSDDATKSHTTQPLKDTKSRRRRIYTRQGRKYQPGAWAASEGSEVVNTSGWRFKEDFDAWEVYVKELEAEGKKMDDWDALLSNPRQFLRARRRRIVQAQDLAEFRLGALVTVAGTHVTVAAVLWQFIRRM
jgi:hypothetical protein